MSATAAEITTDLLKAIANGRGFRWGKPQPIGNGEVAVFMSSGFGIHAEPHPFSYATFTVVYGDLTEYDMDSTFNNPVEAVALTESL